MKKLSDATVADEVKRRLAQVQLGSERRWGTMEAPQAMAHCSRGLEMALGMRKPPRLLIGRIIGWMVKRLALGNDKPMRPNSPTAPDLIVKDTPDLAAERERLRDLVDRFVAAYPSGCTTHPHAFFGRLTPEEWAELTYKHLDHHLRQFGA